MFRYSSISFKLYWENQCRVSKYLKKNTINILRCNSSNQKDYDSENRQNINSTHILILTITGVVALSISQLSEKINIFQTTNLISQLKNIFVVWVI
jgi:hypothetical protein